MNRLESQRDSLGWKPDAGFNGPDGLGGDSTESPTDSRESAARDVECGTARMLCPTTSTGLALFAPLHYEPNYKYPLLVWLHAPRANEGQLRHIMPLVSMRNFIGVGPRGTVQANSNEAGEPTFGWGQSDEELCQAQDRVRGAIAAARERFNINGQRIFLVGTDSAGTVAFRLALSEPELFAGVISIGGPFPTAGRPLARINQARRLSVLICCNRESGRYPESAVCENLRLLHAAGLTISVRQYPGKHGVSPQILGDVNRWIMEEITQAPRADG